MNASEFQSILENIVEDFVQKKKYKAAVNELENLFSQFGEDGELFYYMGICYANIGEFRKAASCLEKSITFNELSLVFQIHSLVVLGYLHTELKNFEKLLLGKKFKGTTIES